MNTVLLLFSSLQRTGGGERERKRERKVAIFVSLLLVCVFVYVCIHTQDTHTEYKHENTPFLDVAESVEQ